MLTEVRIDETPRSQGEPVPVDPVGDFRGKMVTEKPGGVGRISEALFEQLIMGLVDSVVAHGRYCAEEET